MLAVRLATLEDAEAIHLLSALLGYADSPSGQTTERLRSLLASETDAVWVAESAGQLLGWVHAFVAHRLASAAFVEIGGLVVDDTARRSGVGRALVQCVSEYAQKRDMAVRVRCNAKRTDSHAFYRDIGFDSLKSQQVFGR